jgi:hypothetical protein
MRARRDTDWMPPLCNSGTTTIGYLAPRRVWLPSCCIDAKESWPTEIDEELKFVYCPWCGSALFRPNQMAIEKLEGEGEK